MVIMNPPGSRPGISILAITPIIRPERIIAITFIQLPRFSGGKISLLSATRHQLNDIPDQDWVLCNKTRLQNELSAGEIRAAAAGLQQRVRKRRAWRLDANAQYH